MNELSVVNIVNRCSRFSCIRSGLIRGILFELISVNKSYFKKLERVIFCIEFKDPISEVQPDKNGNFNLDRAVAFLSTDEDLNEKTVFLDFSDNEVILTLNTLFFGEKDGEVYEMRISVPRNEEEVCQAMKMFVSDVNASILSGLY